MGSKINWGKYINWKSAPFIISLIGFLIYFLGLVLAVQNGGDIMPQFFPVRVVDINTIYIIYIFTFILIILANILSIKRLDIKHSIKLNSKFDTAIGILYIIIGLSSLIYIIISLNILQGITHGNSMSFYQNIATNLQKMSLLKYYFLSQASIIGIWSLFKRKPFIYVITSMILVGMYLLITRREVTYFICLLLLANPYIKKIYKILFSALILILGISSLLLRISPEIVNRSYIDAFFGSQEFYPFQFGAYAIDKTLFTNHFPDFSLISLANTTSGMKQYDLFGFYGYGPTVGVGFTALITGFFPVFLIYLFTFSIYNIIYTNINKYNNLEVLLYFICIKIFIFTRNGEIITYLIDVILFSILIIPLLSKKENK